MASRILIAPDKFKGSLTALEAAEAIARGFRESEPDAVLDLCPIADGGEGFMATIAGAMKGRWVEVDAVDALERSIRSRYFLAETGEGPVAVIEMAETAGMWRLSREELNPVRATTRGVGIQMADAIRNQSVARIVVGLGGSATNDGGCGMAAELGVRFCNDRGAMIDPLPIHMEQVQSVDRCEMLALPPVMVACDVDNPLLGPSGATAVFSAQKGAGEEDQVALERGLTHLVSIAAAVEEAAIPGAGAAGGLGFGLVCFAGAKLVPGFDLVADLLGLDARIERADLIVTGEGSLDFQSLGGKAPVALARRANGLGKRTLACCGRVDQQLRDSGIFDRVMSLTDTGLSESELMRDAGELLTRLVEAG